MLTTRSFLLLLLLLALAYPAGLGALERRRPNILFIFTDDHAPHAIGAYGSKINTTPNIDRLAREGIRFANCFCTNSICAPSRAVILTGKHSHLNGVMTNRERFDGSQQTFPKLLRTAGYQTAMIGKWHLKTEPTGFDFWEVLIGQGPYYNPTMRIPGGTRKHIGYTTDIITDLALEWLREGRDPEKPFLLMCQHKAPHREWAPGPKHLNLYDDVTIPEPTTLFDDWSNRTTAAANQEMTIAGHMSERDLKLKPPPGLTPEQLDAWNTAYEPKNAAYREAGLEGKALVRWRYQRYIKDYLRCVASVDDNIGRLLKYLEEAGLTRDTIVLYSSDQGFYLGDHGWYDKRWMYEESLRMPLVARWPGVIKAGTVDEHLVQNLDFGPTFLDLAGVEVPADMQGRSLVPLLRGQSPDDWRTSIYYHYWEYPAVHMVARHYGVRTARHKLIRYYEIDEWELFDLEEDPDELVSVYSDPAYASIVANLKKELTRLQELAGDSEPHVPLAELGQRDSRRRARGVELRQVLQLDKPGDTTPEGVDLDPSEKPITVGAWCTVRPGEGKGNGVIVAQGGASLGYALYLRDGRPVFAVRNEGLLREVAATAAIESGRPVHIAGVLRPNGTIQLMVAGETIARGDGHLIVNKPADGLSVGDDTGSPVADYGERPTALDGELRDLRIYWGVLGRKAFRAWARAGVGD